MATPQTEPPSRPSAEPDLLVDSYDYSLVLGGPTFQLFRRSHLAGNALELLHRRLIAITLFAWLPLFLLALLNLRAGTVAPIAFFRDIEVHVRFLVALPVLIAAELIVHSRIRAAVHAFVDRRVVLPEDLPSFRAAIESATKLRNSIALELGILAFVYTVGLLVWNDRTVLNVGTWYAMPGGRWHLTPAGYWYVFVSIPLFQFIVLRWYMRFFVWFRLLWRISRMNLHLVATHPDRCAGLGFIGKSSYAFGPILFAQGAIMAAILASRILYNGESVLSFKVQIVGFVAFFVAAVLIPLLMFTPRMAEAKRKGLAEYGVLAQRYVDRFEQKWVRGSEASEKLLGTGDLQSLADLANSYDIVRLMRPVPFGLQDITRLGVATATPFVPLLLTIFSPEELIMRIIKILF